MERLNTIIKESDGTWSDELRRSAIYILKHLEDDESRFSLSVSECCFHLTWHGNNLFTTVGQEDDDSIFYVISIFPDEKTKLVLKPTSKEECIKFLKTHSKML